jgi:hypothetical protein
MLPQRQAANAQHKYRGCCAARNIAQGRNLPREWLRELSNAFREIEAMQPETLVTMREPDQLINRPPWRKNQRS